MSSFNGRIVTSGNQRGAIALVPFAKQLAFTVDNKRQSSRTESLSHTFTFDDGSTIHVNLMGSMSEIYIFATDTFSKTLPPGIGPVDYYSGLVFGGAINKTIIPLGNTFEESDKLPDYRLFSYYPTKASNTKFGLTTTEFKPVQVNKLAVALDKYFTAESSILPINKPDNVTPSQTMYLKASLYYGSMRKLVQFLLGIGKPFRPTWYALALAFEVPENASEADIAWVNDEADAKTNVDTGVQITYDFRFDRSYGLYKEKDKVWWIVRVDKVLGVLAMPLELDPLSTLESFQKAVEEAYTAEDGSGVHLKEDMEVLKLFGGFPIGTDFNPHIEACIRAGMYIRLLSIDDMEEVSYSSVWSDQIGWAFNYDGNYAKVVAYQDIQLTGNKVCRVTRDMSLKFTITTAEPFVIGEVATRLAAIVNPLIPETKPWLFKKLLRLKEDDAIKIYQAITSNGKLIEGFEGAALTMLEDAIAVPPGEGSATFTINEERSFSPPVRFFKAASLVKNMCESVFLNPTVQYVDLPEYPRLNPGDSIPIYRWFTETDEEKCIWYSAGEKAKFRDNRTTPSTFVEYNSIQPGCFVDKVLGAHIAKTRQPNPFFEYKSFGMKSVNIGISTSNDITPEGVGRSDWIMIRTTTGRGDGGTEKMDFELGSAYMVLGDNEAALEFRYIDKAHLPAYTEVCTLGTTANAYNYDWYYGKITMHNGFQIGGTELRATCYEVNSPSGYCHFPDTKEHTYISQDEWRNPREYDNFIAAVNVGHWAAPDASIEDMIGDPAPELPAPISVPARAASCEMWVKLYIGNEVLDGVPDSLGTYVSRDAVYYDVLEVRGSMFQPPDDSPYIEQTVQGTSNCFGDLTGSIMKGVNNFTYVVVGEELCEDQNGDFATYIGYVAK